MSFTAEDGTGLVAANAYIDVAYADTYHADRGHTAWAGVTVSVTTQQKQEALIRATDHIDRVWGTFFRGYKARDAQGLQWPRTGAHSPNRYPLLNVPSALQKATAEYAIRALQYGVLTPDPPPRSPRQTLVDGDTLAEYGEAEGEMILTREKVGPIETEARYNKNSSGELAKHPAADMLLRTLIYATDRRIVRG